MSILQPLWSLYKLWVHLRLGTLSKESERIAWVTLLRFRLRLRQDGLRSGDFGKYLSLSPQRIRMPQLLRVVFANG